MPRFLKIIKRSFDSLRSLRMTLGESGVIQLVPLLLILAGIVAGVYLVQKSGYQIFKPKAAGASIQFIDHSQSSTSCVTTKDNKQVTTCPTIQFKLFSPLENQSYNSLPGLVSEAYAHDEGLDENESKRCDSVLGVHVVRKNDNRATIVETCWPGAQECREYQFEDGHDWARCVPSNFPDCDGEIVAKRSAGRGGQFIYTCEPKAQPAKLPVEQPSAPQGPAPECSNDTACVDGNACTEDSCQDGKCVYTNSSEGKICNFATGATCDGEGKCIPPAEPTSAPTSVPAPTRTPTQRPPGVAAPQPTPGETSPQLPQGGTPTCITGPAGPISAAQADCVLKLRPDIVPFFKQNNWCTEVNDYPGIVNNWMGINNQADKDQVKGCFGGGTTTRVTKKYRVAENSDKFQDRQYGWESYTPGVIVKYTFEDKTPGLKYIYVQFEDDQGNIINNTPITAQIELVEVKKEEKPTTAVCPLDNFRNFDIPTLKQKCKNSELAKLPVSALADFSNQDLLDIAKSVDGESGPYKFLSQFDNNRLSSFDLAVLKKLTEDRINSLPENLKNVIKGTGTTQTEAASCGKIVVSGSVVRYATVSFTGNPTTLKIWVASNSEIGKSASDVGSWTQVKVVSSPNSGSFYEFDLPGFVKGSHAVLMSLHGSYGQMLDGNPGGVVNPNCATTLDIL